MISRRALVVLAACTFGLCACRQPKVEAYRVPKDPEPPATASADAASGAAKGAPAAPAPAATAPQNTMANTPVATAGGPGLAWTAPASWTAKQGSAMRKATYGIKADGAPGEAELAITAFPGDVGGELANVNRWRGQIQLPPVSEQDLGTVVTRVEHNGLTFAVVDFVGASAGAQRMLGAIVPHAGATWFFKVLGPDAVVAKAKPEFMAFLATVKPAPATP
jgi:hypothetical protein